MVVGFCRPPFSQDSVKRKILSEDSNLDIFIHTLYVPSACNIRLVFAIWCARISRRTFLQSLRSQNFVASSSDSPPFILRSTSLSFRNDSSAPMNTLSSHRVTNWFHGSSLLNNQFPSSTIICRLTRTASSTTSWIALL